MSELKKRINSFGYAFKGVISLLKKEHNAWIHCLAIVVVTLAGLFFSITSVEWCIVTLCFGMVLAAEAFNTSIERLVDMISPDFHPITGDVKDIAAGAVLICAVASTIIGIIIFLPYIMNC